MPGSRAQHPTASGSSAHSSVQHSDPAYRLVKNLISDSDIMIWKRMARIVLSSKRALLPLVFSTQASGCEGVPRDLAIVK